MYGIHFDCPNQKVALNNGERRLPVRFWLLHVGTAKGSVRQYRAQMARLGRASPRQYHRCWRHYYTETDFLDEIRKVLRLRDQWALIAGVSPDGDELPAADRAAPSLPGSRPAA